ncbi:MAG TPA: DUF1670 domain-containing protein [Desulfobacteraceae bacterium]|nr:DUF1670 domain-containing protein [Desulfobacteraceae bacterium]
MKTKALNRYESIPKRSFQNSVIRLLEENYKLIGSHKVIQMIADDIVKLHKEFYPELEKKNFGYIVWRTTRATHRKPSYGTKAEDYQVQTVVLPLVTDADIDNRIKSHYSHRDKDGKCNYRKQTERDIEVMARLIKSAAEQGGWLTGAELSVLLNRSLSTIGRYMRIYHETHDDILPTKGMMLDQGSKPSHKGAIIDLFEQGYPEPDIARMTNHTIDSTSRYIKNYNNIKILLEKNFNIMEIVRVTGRGRSTVLQYRDLIYKYHPSLKKKTLEKKEEN